MLKKEKLHLIEAKEISFTGKEGNEITKYKYTFLSPTDEIIEGYLDNDSLAIHCEPSGIYEEKSALLYFWEGRVWDKKMKYKLTDHDPLKP